MEHGSDADPCSVTHFLRVLSLRPGKWSTTVQMAAAADAAARILIVDDDETVLHTFSKALALEGLDVRVAQSPLTGLQELDQVPPAAILLDLRRPFVNGIG